nr:MAG TPA: hypothetical protein [Caudoviricetes sp.]
MSSFSLGYRVLNLGSSLCNASEYIENDTLKKTMDLAGTAAIGWGMVEMVAGLCSGNALMVAKGASNLVPAVASVNISSVGDTLTDVGYAVAESIFSLFD